jgi:uncharacterized protein (DUF2249 family)
MSGIMPSADGWTDDTRIGKEHAAMTPRTEIDVRPLPPGVRHERVFKAFDALAPGGAFVLVSDHDPRPLLYTFQAERPGAFDWNVLETGPACFRVEIARRPRPGRREVTETLMTDHARLDAILTEVGDLVIGGRFDEAASRYAEFTCGLTRHIAMEERILFPAFEEASGGRGGGPTEVMRLEHVAIKRAMQEAADGIRDKDAGRFGSAVMELRDTIGPHNLKEEHILYPMTDAQAGDARGRDDLVRRMQGLEGG